MNPRFCLLLGLLACSKFTPGYRSACYVEGSHLAQDADGGVLQIADARRGTRLPGFTPISPEYLIFRRGRITVEWAVFDSQAIEELEYTPGSRKANIIDPLDGGDTSYPILVEGSPPKSVTFGYRTEICLRGSPPPICAETTEEKMVYVTYKCREEWW